MSGSRMVNANDLVLQRDIAERLGMHPTAVANLASGRRKRCEFPRPISGRGNRGIWLWSEVQSWYEQHWPKTVEAQRLAESAARIRDTRRRRAA